MQRLILLRHGKAESASSSGEDFERALTDRGRRDSALMGRVLSDRGLTPDLALVSTARRARETWAEAAFAFPAARVQSLRPLYLASAQQIDQSIAGLRSGDSYKVFKNPMDACRGADLVTTDVWTSMGYEAENEARKKAFADWCVDADMMAVAKPDALFMHCLPAHRGEEVEAEVIDGPQSVVWDEAENRMHVQKVLMEYLLLGRIG